MVGGAVTVSVFGDYREMLCGVCAVAGCCESVAGCVVNALGPRYCQMHLEDWATRHPGEPTMLTWQAILTMANADGYDFERDVEFVRGIHAMQDEAAGAAGGTIAGAAGMPWVGEPGPEIMLLGQQATGVDEMKTFITRVTDADAGDEVPLWTVKTGDAVLLHDRPFLIAVAEYRERAGRTPKLYVEMEDARGSAGAWPLKYRLEATPTAQDKSDFFAWRPIPSEILRQEYPGDNGGIIQMTESQANALIQHYHAAEPAYVALDHCRDMLAAALSMVHRMARGYDWTPAEVDAFEAACRDVGIE